MVDWFGMPSTETTLTVEFVFSVKTPDLNYPFGVVSSKRFDIAATSYELVVSMDNLYKVARVLLLHRLDTFAVKVHMGDIALTVDQQHKIIEVVPSFIGSRDAHNLILLACGIDSQNLGGLLGRVAITQEELLGVEPTNVIW